MNFKKNESAAKLRGGYYTDPEIAIFLSKWVLHISPQSILEPSCGDGVFFQALSTLKADSVKLLMGFEIEQEEAAKANQIAHSMKHVQAEVQVRDFLSWSLTRLVQPPLFDAVVGNPPFIRYQYLDDRSQDMAQSIFKFFHLPFTKHTNSFSARSDRG